MGDISGIRPAPTDEEAAAIVAAVEVLWPKPVAVADDPRDRTPAWRFAGRWWRKPVPVVRDRPYWTPEGR